MSIAQRRVPIEAQLLSLHKLIKCKHPKAKVCAQNLPAMAAESGHVLVVWWQINSSRYRSQALSHGPSSSKSVCLADMAKRVAAISQTISAFLCTFGFHSIFYICCFLSSFNSHCICNFTCLAEPPPRTSTATAYVFWLRWLQHGQLICLHAGCRCLCCLCCCCGSGWLGAVSVSTLDLHKARSTVQVVVGQIKLVLSF